MNPIKPKITFDRFVNNRKKFLKENSNKDHVIIEGTNNILISAPHGVPQIRLGRSKTHEIGALSAGLYLHSLTNCFFIAKTKCNNDDVNFDEKSKYKNSIRKLIKKHKIKYILDFHGLNSSRECDVNLGIHLGENIKNNVNLFESLYNELIANDFIVYIDQPFMAGSNTISGSMKNEFNDLWTLQIEINCKLTNKKENFKKCNKLIQILLLWINSIDN